ncbi:MAG: hypothetical protein H3C35_00540 [Bacteroidetes bacterium]|nr:hypothetical protein [Bacteroidota bacterium]
MRSDKVIYSLCIQDIQVVALEILDRKLTKEELDKVLGPIADRISWYDVIEDVITQEIEFNSDKP